MTQYTLTMLDTSGIQPYVFGSNRLQENIGASELVFRVTTLWAFKALIEAGLEHNIERPESLDWDFRRDRRIEDPNDDLEVEVVYAGGGNTMLIFSDNGKAQGFVRHLTRRILKEAPGLTLVARHLAFDWNESLGDKRKEILKTLAAHKQARLPSTPFLGMGVTSVCESTGLAATRSNEGTVERNGELVPLRLGKEEPRLISRETLEKLAWRDAANQRLEERFGRSKDRLFKFPSDIDLLGRVMGEESYVAIVHADGNRMGQHFDRAGAGIEDNRKWIEAVREFSQNVKKASMQALKSVVERLDENIRWDRKRKQLLVNGVVPLAENRWLPFRPLVFGGDDVTFLCNGQLGVSLAVAYLEAFERETGEAGLKDMYACAGVAMVKIHYPFARAYDLSEQLAKNAKKLVRQEQGDDCSALDWHFATSGLSGSLGAIRKREYVVSAGELTLRPIRLDPVENDQSGRYWLEGLENVMMAFRHDRQWLASRNKVIGLREVLRDGPAGTEQYRLNYELGPLPALLPREDTHQQSGWYLGQCIHFDAIELLDHYVDLR